ncbi:cellulose synthase-like protein H1, partial [Phalaenopsis equestris]|uniref:cellulose synthase-like protein H1 n=1 Tax=Phalaenopsis equestris TaxID=78828 RepID=UPI0009E49808
ILQILWENKDEIDGISHLIYVSREKRPKHLHHFKAGAMNVLTRVSALMTNAPFILNVDCDMFANNHKVILHGMCLMLGLDEEASCGYAQLPQRFHGTLKDDPFGNKLEVLQKFVGEGIAGIQGPLNGGTGSFHRRKIIYGCSPSQLEGQEKTTHESFPCKELKRVFGNSEELIQSTNVTIMQEAKPGLSFNTEVSSKIEIAKQVAASTYEQNTSWGKEIGWMYGSMNEDVLTGIRIHSMGWKSAHFDPNPAGFLGLSPSGGPESLTQYKRWATGLLEILIDRQGPLQGTLTKRLQFRQCLAYVLLSTWALRSIPELIYALLPAYCLISGTSFLPKASEREFLLVATLFASYIIYCVAEFKLCGKSYREWWNNHRMQRITPITAFLFGFLSVVFKLLGVSDTVFEVTRKNQSPQTGQVEPGRFTFDRSPVFISGTAVVLVHIMAAGMVLLRLAGWATGGEAKGSGVGEMVCCGWILVAFGPFVRGLFGNGSYGIPWSVVIKAGAFSVFFFRLSVSL